MHRLIRITVVLAALAFAFRTLPAIADEPAKSAARKVIASSTATVMVKPDAARISFRIGASEDAGKSAHEANEAQVKKLRAALEAQPIDLAMMDIQVVTGGVNPTVLADPNRPNDRTLKSKRAETVFHVTINDTHPDKLRETVSRIAELAADNGAIAPDNDDQSRPYIVQRRLVGGAFGNANPEPEQVPGATIEWLRVKNADARRTAVQRAVADAMSDAQAAVGDVKLTVAEIEVTPLDDEPQYITVRRGSTNAQTGQVPIRVRVKVTCTY